MLHPQTSRITEVIDDIEVRVDDDASRVREAEALYKTLENWQDAPELHERVRAGNNIYRHAAQVSLIIAAVVRLLYAPCFMKRSSGGAQRRGRRCLTDGRPCAGRRGSTDHAPPRCTQGASERHGRAKPRKYDPLALHELWQQQDGRRVSPSHPPETCASPCLASLRTPQTAADGRRGAGRPLFVFFRAPANLRTLHGISLTWPVIIAGSQLYGADRARVLSIFELFRYVPRAPAVIKATLTLGPFPPPRSVARYAALTGHNVSASFAS